MVTYARIGVVIVAFQSDQWLDRCLDSVLQDPQCHCCILVDNDGSGARAAQRSGVTYIRSPSNIGFGAGCNLGFDSLRDKPAELDVFAAINPDTWLEAEWGESMCAAFDQHTHYGILSPLQLTYDDTGEMSPWAQLVLGNIGANPPKLIPVHWSEGSALFIRRHVWEQLNGLDPLFPMYFEEVDLCRRALCIGYHCGVVTTARYHHATGGSFGDACSPDRIMRKDLGQTLYMATDPQSSWLMTGVAILRLLLRRGRRWLKGKYPQFPRFCYRVIQQLWVKRHEIRANRKSDTALRTAQ